MFPNPKCKSKCEHDVTFTRGKDRLSYRQTQKKRDDHLSHLVERRNGFGPVSNTSDRTRPWVKDKVLLAVFHRMKHTGFVPATMNFLSTRTIPRTATATATDVNFTGTRHITHRVSLLSHQADAIR